MSVRETEPSPSFAEAAGGPASVASASAPPVAADEQRSMGTVALTDAEGWVTARPPKAAEIVQRVLRFPMLLVTHKDLVWTSVKRELESRFQGTMLGWFWPLVHPLFLFAVYYFIFSELLNMKFPDLPEDKKAAFGVWMFVGITAWAAIAETLNRGTNVIVDNGNLIKKMAFPSEVLPFNLTIAALVTLSFSIAMFVLACVFTPMWPAPGFGILWVLPLLAVQGVFTYGLTLLLATLQVFLRDTAQVVVMVTTVWMFATPIFWSPHVLGEDSKVENYIGLIEANPIFHLVQAWRGALLGDIPIGDGAFVSQAAGIGGHVAVVAVWALAFYVIGFSVFVLSQRRFADEV